MKLFEWIGGPMAVLCLAEMAHNPKGAMEAIRRGPVPNPAAFNRQLHKTQGHKARPCQKQVNIGKVIPI